MNACQKILLRICCAIGLHRMSFFHVGTQDGERMIQAVYTWRCERCGFTWRDLFPDFIRWKP